jgi:hypothetical protein
MATPEYVLSMRTTRRVLQYVLVHTLPTGASEPYLALRVMSLT